MEFDCGEQGKDSESACVPNDTSEMSDKQNYENLLLSSSNESEIKDNSDVMDGNLPCEYDNLEVGVQTDEDSSSPSSDNDGDSVFSMCDGEAESNNGNDEGNSNSQESGTVERRALPHEGDPCDVCHIRRKNGIFVHGSFGHMLSCYTCAVQIWNNTGICPLCDKKSKEVIKLYATRD